jgi:hypothetical protein
MLPDSAIPLAVDRSVATTVACGESTTDANTIRSLSTLPSQCGSPLDLAQGLDEHARENRVPAPAASA